ncbi:MAG TPA: glycolate oxidase subunit GlcF [Caulobacteraceae bacterium]|nr:glycolate oxidase subunit GlcF [Caulobacteraceae bacterium]
MRTSFSQIQLQDPDIRTAEQVLRKCVRCGFCTATCPTYQLLGDELDGPRGRIHQIQHMLETEATPSPETVKHVDRCLSCLACETACPSGVSYRRLVDQARDYIEQRHGRPLSDRWLRSLLARVLTHPGLFRTAARLAGLFRWAEPYAPGRLKGLIAMAPRSLPAMAGGGVHPPPGERKFRVALLGGCVQAVLDPEINAAAVRLLNRLGATVTVSEPACCGGLPHHLGKMDQARALAAGRIEAWNREIEAHGLDAIVVTTSGCGTEIKDYGHMFRDHPALAKPAARVSALALDITELLERTGLPPVQPKRLRVAYHAACSLQHGQQVKDTPRRLLAAAGFEVLEPRESHLCCGSAGTYNMLQPSIATQLRERKAEHLAALDADVIAAGNLGCMMHLAPALIAPIVHTVQLLDWATGGPRPQSVNPRPAKTATRLAGFEIHE